MVHVSAVLICEAMFIEHEQLVWHSNSLMSRCSCKTFWHDMRCSHTMLLSHMRGELDLAALMEQLPKNKKRGRKRAAAPALVRQVGLVERLLHNGNAFPQYMSTMH